MVLKRHGYIRGFTLIELSIVLVVIGLIVGGILVGQSLVAAAEVRAQITQIEKYNSAVNTFRSKFNAIPGDMLVSTAQQFGFTIGTNCSGGQGARDGNGLIDSSGAPYILGQALGETELFWVDLGASGLIDISFTMNGCSTPLGSITGTAINQYMPPAKIGHGASIYVYDNNGTNWYGISTPTQICIGCGGMSSNANISVNQSYRLDAKIDDGAPMTGNVQAIYINGNTTNIVTAPNITTSGGNSWSCYDTTTSTYSITYNNGSGGNCALSFKMQ